MYHLKVKGKKIKNKNFSFSYTPNQDPNAFVFETDPYKDARRLVKVPTGFPKDLVQKGDILWSAQYMEYRSKAIHFGIRESKTLIPKMSRDAFSSGHDEDLHNKKKGKSYAWWDKLGRIHNDGRLIQLTFRRGGDEKKITFDSSKKWWGFTINNDEGAMSLGDSRNIRDVTEDAKQLGRGLLGGDRLFKFQVEGEAAVDTRKELWGKKWDEKRKAAKQKGKKFHIFVWRFNKDRGVVNKKRRRLSQLDRLVRELQRASSME